MSDQPLPVGHVSPEQLQDAGAAALLAQQHLSSLATLDLEARWKAQPTRDVLTFGSGNENPQLLYGNQQVQFRGVTILNPTDKQLQVGFESGGGGPLLVPPGQGVTWPAVFTNLSIAVSGADAEGPPQNVIVLRLFYPPAQPMVFPYEAFPSPTVYKLLPEGGLAFAGAETVAVWTPNPGKRFRMLGYWLGSKSESFGTALLELMDGATRFGQLIPNGFGSFAPVSFGTRGRGYLSIGAGNSLSLKSHAANSIAGMFWGTEE